MTLISAIQSTKLYHYNRIRGDESLSVILQKNIKKNISPGMRVRIYIGMGNSEIIAKYPNGFIKTHLIPNCYYPRQKDIDRTRSIENHTQTIRLAVLIDNKWELLEEKNLYPFYALDLAKSDLSSGELKKFSTYEVNNKSYFIDFYRMRQVRSDNNKLTRPIKWVPVNEKII